MSIQKILDIKKWKKSRSSKFTYFYKCPKFFPCRDNGNSSTICLFSNENYTSEDLNFPQINWNVPGTSMNLWNSEQLCYTSKYTVQKKRSKMVEARKSTRRRFHVVCRKQGYIINYTNVCCQFCYIFKTISCIFYFQYILIFPGSSRVCQ